MLKQSRYTVVRDLDERGLPDHHLVFNTRSTRCICIEKRAWSRVISACDTPPADPTLARLVSLGILVGDSADEAADFLEHFDRVRFHPRRIYPIFAVTSACNIGCTYCYEAGVIGKTMRPDVVSAIARWVERRIRIDGINEIYPSLFGGEPLLFPKILFSIMDQLNDVVARYGATCAFSSSSNGMLLTSDLASQLSARGLNQIQISLDGSRVVHDARRVGKQGQHTFDASLAGIRVAVDYIENVTLKVNFDRHNFADLPILFEQLAAEGLAGKVDVKLETIAKQFPGSTVKHDEEFVIPPDSLELSSAYIGLSLAAERSGFKVRRDTAHTTPCMFSSHHGILVGPSGNIYKCISLVGRPEYRVGTIWDDTYDLVEYESQMNVRKKTEECVHEKCAYLPVCGGGCSYESITRSGRYDERFCTKDYLADLHFKRNLVKHEKYLVRLGAKPLLTGDELSSGCGGKCSGGVLGASPCRGVSPPAILGDQAQAGV